MTHSRLLVRFGVALALLGVVAPTAIAQGVTTGALTGTVTDASGNPIPSAQVQIVNRSTGFTANATTRESGLYFVQGLEVGGPYSVTVRRIGYQPSTQDNITVGLSQARRVDVRLTEQVVALATVEVRGAATDIIAPTMMGTRTTLNDTAIQRLPNLSRSLTDLIRVAPQVSQSGPGYSAGGMSNRMNNIQLDGATERDVFGLGSTGQPGAEVGARSVSLEAVKEIQILLAPFDVRQGNFGGLLLNAVTKGGTNALHGSVYHGFRNQSYGRNVPALRNTVYNRSQWAFSLGGPIIKDRLHFFVAPEFQSENQPVGGPYRGQVGAINPLEVAAADLDRFESLMTGYGGNPGSMGLATRQKPLSNVFARLDWRINDVHRAVVRYNYSGGEETQREFSTRTQSRAVYTSNFHTFSIVKKAPVLQIYSNFRGGSFNELFLGYNDYQHRRVPNLIFPQVTVTVPRAGGGSASIIGGADQFSMKNELDTKTYEITDNFTIPLGRHNVTIGTRNELVKLRNQFNQSSYGIWSFRSLDSLAAGNANTFRKSFILRNNGNILFDALQTAVYVQDQWQARSDLNFTLGLRADVSSFLKGVDYSAPIDSAYGRRTDNVPKRTLQFSPRIGFNWDIGGTQVNQLRGGIGLFVGTPPYVWLENAYINNGLTTVFLNCNTGGSRDPAPRFQPDPASITACGNGAGSAPIGAVNFLASDLKFPQPLRATLGFDRQLFGDLVATVEGLYSKTLNQFFFVNRNLVDPRGVDKRGRVLYGDTIRLNGQSLPTIPPRVVANGGASRFSEAFDIVNQNKDYAYNLTFQLAKRYSNNWQGAISYTRSRARDVQSFTSSTHSSNWAFGRTYSGNQLQPYTAVSLFDQPHKFAMSGTRTITPFGDLATDLSFVFQRVSGPPFDYVYGRGSAFGSGDLNADGRQGNDPIYVPRDARDPAEIIFRQSGAITPAQQADAFERYINNSECLSANRGRILSRNSCRNPTQTTLDLSIRQNLPMFGRQRVSAQLDFFNFGNAINKDWGHLRSAGGFSTVNLLTHVGQTGLDPKTSDPIFTFNVNQQEFRTGDSAFDYWRAQMGFRYSF